MLDRVIIWSRDPWTTGVRYHHVLPEALVKRIGFISFCVLAAAACFPFAGLANDDPFFENKFDGVWAGYLELEGIEMPLLVNLNSQKAATGGFVFFLAGGEDGEPFEFRPFAVSGLKVRKNKVVFGFDAFEHRRDEVDYRSKLFDVTLKYNKKQGSLKGTFSVVDPTTGETYTGSVVLYLMEIPKPIQGLWQGSFPDFVEEDLPLFLLLTQNSPVGGRLLLMPQTTPLKNGDFTNNFLTGSLDIDTEAGFNATLELELRYAKNTMSGTVGYRLPRGRFIGADVTLRPAATRGREIAVNSVKPRKLSVGATVEITIGGSNFAEGAVVHVDHPKVTVTGVEFQSSSKLRASLGLARKMAEGTRIGVRVVNPDNQRAEKADALTVGSD